MEKLLNIIESSTGIVLSPSSNSYGTYTSHRKLLRDTCDHFNHWDEHQERADWDEVIRVIKRLTVGIRHSNEQRLDNRRRSEERHRGHVVYELVRRFGTKVVVPGTCDGNLLPTMEPTTTKEESLWEFLYNYATSSQPRKDQVLSLGEILDVIHRYPSSPRSPNSYPASLDIPISCSSRKRKSSSNSLFDDKHDDTHRPCNKRPRTSSCNTFDDLQFRNDLTFWIHHLTHHLSPRAQSIQRITNKWGVNWQAIIFPLFGSRPQEPANEYAMGTRALQSLQEISDSCDLVSAERLIRGHRLVLGSGFEREEPLRDGVNTISINQLKRLTCTLHEDGSRDCLARLNQISHPESNSSLPLLPPNLPTIIQRVSLGEPPESFRNFLAKTSTESDSDLLIAFNDRTEVWRTVETLELLNENYLRMYWQELQRELAFRQPAHWPVAQKFERLIADSCKSSKTSTSSVYTKTVLAGKIKSQLLEEITHVLIYCKTKIIDFEQDELGLCIQQWKSDFGKEMCKFIETGVSGINNEQEAQLCTLLSRLQEGNLHGTINLSNKATPRDFPSVVVAQRFDYCEDLERVCTVEAELDSDPGNEPAVRSISSAGTLTDRRGMGGKFFFLLAGYAILYASQTPSTEWECRLLMPGSFVALAPNVCWYRYDLTDVVIEERYWHHPSHLPQVLANWYYLRQTDRDKGFSRKERDKKKAEQLVNLARSAQYTFQFLQDHPTLSIGRLLRLLKPLSEIMNLVPLKRLIEQKSTPADLINWFTTGKPWVQKTLRRLRDQGLSG